MLPERKQEAQLPQRNSASAAHVYLGWLTDRASTEHRRIAEVVLVLTFNFNLPALLESERLKISNALIQEVLAENTFCREIATQGHSRSFILQSFAGDKG